jgi:hypothetical protein
MFRVATVAVLLILGLLILNLVCGYAPDYPLLDVRFFRLWGTLSICGFCGRDRLLFLIFYVTENT